MRWEWNTELDLVGGLLAVALLYRMALRLGWRRWLAASAPLAAAPPVVQRIALTPASPPFPTRALLLMDASLVVFYLAVGSPLDEASDRFLFTAHMVQHSILVFVLPPMILAALPSYLFTPLAENRVTRAAVRVLTHPAVALAAFNAVFALWHVPWLYEYALRDRGIHQAEHIMFLVTALLMWWPVLSPSADFPRLPPGPRILYLFLASVAQIPLFAFLVMSGEQYYPTYAAAPRIIDITALEDQGIGGIVMKFLGELFFGGYLLAAFLEWYGRENGVAPSPEPLP